MKTTDSTQKETLRRAVEAWGRESQMMWWTMKNQLSKRVLELMRGQAYIRGYMDAMEDIQGGAEFETASDLQDHVSQRAAETYLSCGCRTVEEHNEKATTRHQSADDDHLK
jgi:hypothetical protein